MPQSKRVTIGFVDDDPEEVRIFERVFGEEFTIFGGTRLLPVVERLRQARRRPNLFVLDLYFATGAATSPDQRREMIRLKQEVEAAQRRLMDYLSQIHQSRDGGLRLAAQLRDTYPTVPFVFYTRKGTLDDVDACRDACASFVLRKPHPAQLDPQMDVYTQLEQAALTSKDSLALRFEQFAPAPVWKKFLKAAKLLWTNWKNL